MLDPSPNSGPHGGSTRTRDLAPAYRARQVVALPEPPPRVVTAHRPSPCRGGPGGEATRAGFPEGVPAPRPSGARRVALVVSRLHSPWMPAARLVELMADRFGVRLAAATRARRHPTAAEPFHGCGAAVGQLVKTAAVQPLDAPGFRLGGKTPWRQVAVPTWLSCYRVAPTRGRVLEGRLGRGVHDPWNPSSTRAGVHQALCQAPPRRELQTRLALEKEPWALPMQPRLGRAWQAPPRAGGREGPLTPRRGNRFQRRYDASGADGLACPAAQPPRPVTGRRGRPRRRTGHPRRRRWRTRKDDVVRFLTDSGVPFTHPLAEQAARRIKRRQHISGGFRSEPGARDFAVIRALIATAKKPGWNLIGTLTQAPTVLLSKLRTA